MKQVSVQTGQSLLDVAVQHCGTLEALMDLAALNGVEPGAELPAGLPVLLPAGSFGAPAAGIAERFYIAGYVPATGFVDEGNYSIGNMVIESTFFIR